MPALLRTLALSGALAATLARAISFTSPASASAGAELTATWTSVDTDPAVFSLYVWNFVAWPPYYEPLAFGVDTAAGAATVRLPCHLDAGDGWQLTAINDTNVYVLYAQTDRFNLTAAAADCVDPSSSAACYAPASTVYVTQTAASTLVTTSAPTSTVTASVIQPGSTDVSTTVRPTASAAVISVDVDVDVDVSL